jgi:perosamine synthetase
MTTFAPASASASTADVLAIKGGTPVSATAVPFMATGLTEADIEAVLKVLKSGMLRAASKCAELEVRLGELSQAKHAMTCANGTCALQLAYEPLFKAGDDVLVPAWSYIATVSMVVARGGNPIFVDALPATGQIDVADAARKITKKTTAIAATHMYGCPVDIAAVQALAKANNLKVIYDAAQAHLATYNGQGIGQFGDAVTYSFYATKNLGTGEGGLITCNDDALARQIKLLRSHGETDKYLHEQVGYNYRLNDMAGAIGCSRLDRLPTETNQRRAVAAKYDAVFANDAIPGIRSLAITPGAVSAYHLYTIVLDPARFSVSRDEFGKALAAEGVPNAVHYPKCLTRQPAFAKFIKDHPKVSGELAQGVMSLPMHHAISDAQVRIVADAVAKVARAFKR